MKQRTLKTFRTEYRGGYYTYNREDGYTAYYGDNRLGGADSAAEAEALIDGARYDAAARGVVMIDLPRLVAQAIPVTSASTAELVEHLDGAPDDWTAQPWRALLVDGRWYDLILSKHVIGRPEAQAALDAALAAVEAGIRGLAQAETRKAA